MDKHFTADVLKTRLFAKTPEDQQFCDLVIKKQNDGTIPHRLIYGVYQKAMTKEPNRRFLYFKTALEIMCKREGVALYATPVKTASNTPSSSLPSFIPPALRAIFQRN